MITAPTASATSFRRVIGAEVVSNFGSMMSRLAIPWLAVLTLGATPFEMGLLAVADVVAAAVAALGLGVFIDRHRKRAVMIGADLASAALVAALALGAATATLGFTTLLLAAAASSVLTMAFQLARSAWFAQAAARGDLGRRNAQLEAGSAISESLAFGLTGVLFQWFGSVVALAVDAASYLVSALLLRGIDEPRTASVASASAGAAEASASAAVEARASTAATQARDALGFVLRSRPLRALALLEMLVAGHLGIATTSYMIYVSRDLGVGTGVLGFVFAAGGIGAAIGAALAPRMARRVGEGRALAGGLGLLAAGSVLVPLAGDAGVLAIALLVAQQIVGDAGHVGYSIHDRTLRQTLAPPEALARVDAAIRTLGQAALLAAALGGGWFASAHGARAGLWLSAAFAVMAALATVLLLRAAWVRAS